MTESFSHVGINWNGAIADALPPFRPRPSSGSLVVAWAVPECRQLLTSRVRRVLLCLKPSPAPSMFTYCPSRQPESVRANIPEKPLNQGGIAVGDPIHSLYHNGEKFCGTFYRVPQMIPVGIEPQVTLSSNLLINTNFSSFLFQQSHLYPSPCLCFCRKSK